MLLRCDIGMQFIFEIMCWVEDFVQGKTFWMVYSVEWYHRWLCATIVATNCM